jgi:predicted XRE-type DNA-binding protein
VKQKTWKRWTDDDLFLLESLLGEMPIEAIAKKLGRPENTVRIKARQIGLSIVPQTNHFNCGQLAEILGIEQSTVNEWIRKGELRAKKGRNFRQSAFRITRKNFKRFYMNFLNKKRCLKHIPPETLAWLTE